jgi:uncharacterized protein YndB with AHSA1/START domain
MRKICSLAVGAAVAGLLVVAQILAAHAEVLDVAANGFELKHSFHSDAAPDKVYAALIEPNHWWSSQHSFSGNAENFTLDARAGGCWCEKLANGSVQHMTVVYADPGKMLRLRGALGPFQRAAVDGVLTWTLSPAKNGTDVTLEASIGGYMKDGFAGISQAADKVLGEQAARLKAYIETGSPDVKHRPTTHRRQP